MTKFIALAIAITALAACNNSAKTIQTSTVSINTDTTKTVTNSHVKIDPVCGMTKDSTWTDYTIYKGDSVWFCSAAEKQAFIANPKKYIKN